MIPASPNGAANRQSKNTRWAVFRRMHWRSAGVRKSSRRAIRSIQSSFHLPAIGAGKKPFSSGWTGAGLSYDKSSR